MDRVSGRSFRALELAEHALRELARSRIDTTRDVVFQPLGARYVEAREDVARVATLFREDAFRAQAGHFSRLVLRVPPALTDRLAALDPRAVEARIEEATRAALARELPRAQGVYVARFEPSVRGVAEPVAHVHLSCRQTDGGAAPPLARDQVQRIEERWPRELEKVFGLQRDQALTPARSPDDRSVLNAEADRLRQEHARASARLFATYGDRLAGRASREDLLAATDQVRATRQEWARQVGSPLDLRDVDRRQVFDVVRLRIDGGSRYLSGSLEAHRRGILETAASRAAALPDGRDRHVAVVAWPAGADLHATVYFNQRSRPERPPQSIDPERFRAALEHRLGDELHRSAAGLDATAEARRAVLGRIEARLSEREPDRERAMARAVRPAEPSAGGVAAASIVVAVQREEQREGPRTVAAGDGSERQPIELAKPPERDWTDERVFTIRLRIPTGGDQLHRAQLSTDEIAHVVQRAVDRAYPFLERDGVRGNFLCAFQGKALDVRLVIPEKLGWTHDQLRSPGFQQRLITGFHQALAQIAPARLMPEKERALPGIVHSFAAARTAPDLLRQAEQDPERAAKQATIRAFARLSEALPKPFRLMREIGRGVGRFMSRTSD